MLKKILCIERSVEVVGEESESIELGMLVNIALVGSDMVGD
jgi:hypothetical protein